MKARNLLFIIIIISFTAGLTACGKKEPEYSEVDAKEYFNKKYSFELPETARIIKYTNANINDFKAKIEFKEEDLEYINNGLINFFQIECIREDEVLDCGGVL